MRRLALLLLALGSSVQAQTGDWRTLEPALGVALPLGGGFGPEWTARPGLAARLDAPAYGGRARLAVRVASYATPDPALPEFLSVAASLGWGLEAALPAGLRLGGGPQVGALHLRFDDEDGRFGGNLQNETEATVGAWARLDVPLTRRVSLWAEADVLRVAFADPATITSLGAGLAVRLDTPGWLRTVLE